MTYCCGVLVRDGLVMIADTRTNAGLDNVSTFRKLHIFSKPGDRIMAVASAGNLAISQSVLSTLTEGLEDPHTGDIETLLNAPTMFQAAQRIGRAIRSVHATEGTALQSEDINFDVSFLFGGQIKGARMRLFMVYPAGNFIECTTDTPYLQIGEHKYGKPVLDRAMHYDVELYEALKTSLISMDSTMRSNLGVGLPIDVLVVRTDVCDADLNHRIEAGEPYFHDLRSRWSAALRAAHGNAAGDAKARRQCRKKSSGIRRHDRSRLDRRPVRQGDGCLRPARCSLQQCRHGCAAGAVRGSEPRAMAGGGRHQPDRAVPVHAARVPDHEGPDPARRPHHQQRLDLGARAAAVLLGLHLHQACHHRPDQGDQPRRPRLRHRGRPGRHRQRGDADDGSHGRWRAAAGRPQDTGAAHGRQGGRRRRRLHGGPAARRQRAVHDGDGQQNAVRRKRLNVASTTTIIASQRVARMRARWLLAMTSEFYSSRSTSRSVGNSFIHNSAIAIVPRPPSTAAGTTPNKAAVTPLSNWPSWLEALMNRKFTAPTRPRISSGVASCTSEKRITTLTMSAAPSIASATTESHIHCETANTTVATPNTITAWNMRTPTRRLMVWRARTAVITSAPTAGAARRMPRPQGPVCRISRA